MAISLGDFPNYYHPCKAPNLFGLVAKNRCEGMVHDQSTLHASSIAWPIQTCHLSGLQMQADCAYAKILQMRITHLSLTNFRNYGRLELTLPAGPTLLHGDNAQGKTNLLEAIYYLATARSSHADQDQQLINWQALQPEEPIVVGRLTAQIETNDGQRQIEMRLILEQQRNNGSFRREALVNRRKVRLMDLLGNLRVVLFLPQDVQIVTGSPAKRRRYLDITLCQTDAVYCRTLSAYNKVLEQRNALLRQIAEQGRGRDVLPIYTEKLVHYGSQIFARRAAFVAQLAQEAQRIHYEEMTQGREVIRLNYLPRMTINSFSRGMKAPSRKQPR
jgi:DNA replication and repair protein RecF